MVLVAAIGAIPSAINIFLARQGRTEVKTLINKKAGELHEQMNGKVAELIASSKEANMAEGRAAGVEQERNKERKRQTRK